jgi:hypothetical protein
MCKEVYQMQLQNQQRGWQLKVKMSVIYDFFFFNCNFIHHCNDNSIVFLVELNEQKKRNSFKVNRYLEKK